jgi:hypothetical protein
MFNTIILSELACTLPLPFSVRGNISQAGTPLPPFLLRASARITQPVHYGGKGLPQCPGVKFSEDVTYGL